MGLGVPDAWCVWRGEWLFMGRASTVSHAWVVGNGGSMCAWYGEQRVFVLAHGWNNGWYYERTVVLQDVGQVMPLRPPVWPGWSGRLRRGAGCLTSSDLSRPHSGPPPAFFSDTA